MDSMKTEIVVVGAGPGGYAAAFYAADLGKKVILVEREKRLGGVCLNRGCIPSKALLYATHQISAARESAHRGIAFAEPTVDLDKLRAWKESILEKLGGGVASLAQMRGVQVVRGRGYLEDSKTLRVETDQGQQFIEFERAILAVGSLAAMPKAFDLGNPRVMTSTEALEIPNVPENLLVVGGGYIGMELGTVYAALGSRIVLAEALDAVLTGADPDLARYVVARANKTFKEIRLKARVLKMATAGKQIKVEMEFGGRKVQEL
ncbi:MAG: FAD-dependent oxidoreductase, partial [Verrucomicrobiota bacterium]|nr:FAD-dependent oxidoreductase [Verrucomicrobiota bacterium]